MNNSRDTSRELRGKLDSDDSFMTGGHQILKIRRPRKPVPSWATNNKKVQDLLIRVFPRMKESPKQRVRAGRWARVIHLYFNQRWSRGQIANEMGISYMAAETLIRSIKRAAKGLRSDSGTPITRVRRYL